MILAKQIATLRKKSGMTQAQLAKALQISAQAVSKWEQGGMPDAEMIPRIADALHVTIDTLYGRDTKETEDAVEWFRAHLQRFPQNERMQELFRLLNHVFLLPAIGEQTEVTGLIDSVLELPLEKSFVANPDPNDARETVWMRSALIFSEGIQLGVLAKDCPLYLLLPEPEGGYDNILSDNESYRTFFAMLGTPGVLDILRLLYGLENASSGGFTAEALARRLHTPPQEVVQVLNLLAEARLVSSRIINTGEDEIRAYKLNENGGFIPLLLFARWVMDDSDMWFNYWQGRKQPILNAPSPEENEPKEGKKRHEKNS
ncbi:MAG: helix-turn-helix domain-containing protein [Lachnospiraceae bacterium]|nr:helix-turn-helix domain-containing protein [Lachnospiraceae bacterium]